MITKKSILNTIQKNTEDIKHYGVKRIGVFGSFARSEQRRGSDIDILIDFEQGQKIFDNYMELKFYLERLFKKKIDLVIKDAVKPSIKQYITKEAQYAKL